jgi:hypothetical protein
VRVPVVLDLVVCSSRQVAGDQRPPENKSHTGQSDASCSRSFLLLQKRQTGIFTREGDIFT